jgi:hypothetical protein
MKTFIRDKFKEKKSLAPGEAVYYTPDRPKGMHRKTYKRLLTKLREVQEDYDREFIQAVMRIRGRIDKIAGLI